MRVSKRGRPPQATILAEHAEYVRKAVKAAARYYGVPIKNLAPNGAWITEAMRKKAPLSLETAQRLLAAITVPPLDAVGKRRPQGRSQKQLQEELLAHMEGGGSPSHFKLDAAAEFLGYVSGASIHLLPYQLPAPGIGFFVMPGAARNAAEFVIACLPLGKVSRERIRAITDALTLTFEEAYVPTSDETAQRILPKLYYLALLKTMREAAEAGPFSDHQLESMWESLRGSVRAEHRRERKKNAKRTPPEKRPRRKRRTFR